jgi:hypothetical protein
MVEPDEPMLASNSNCLNENNRNITVTAQTMYFRIWVTNSPVCAKLIPTDPCEIIIDCKLDEQALNNVEDQC